VTERDYFDGCLPSLPPVSPMSSSAKADDPVSTGGRVSAKRAIVWRNVTSTWTLSVGPRPFLLGLYSRQQDRRHAVYWSHERPHSHRAHLVAGFTSEYGVHRLVYFESFSDIENAIRREKRLKKWNRAWKIRLIEESNPDWVDLYPSIAAG
jgi:putative endonuclease